MWRVMMMRGYDDNDAKCDCNMTFEAKTCV
jgi:hypothetical protein